MKVSKVKEMNENFSEKKVIQKQAEKKRVFHYKLFSEAELFMDRSFLLFHSEAGETLKPLFRCEIFV